MQNNPYVAPISDLKEAPGTVEPTFFAVSLTKLAVMSVCTFGYYQIYWFYRNWHYIRALGKPEISAVRRAVFGIIFCYPCLSQIRKTGIARGITSPPIPAVLTLGWTLTSLSGLFGGIFFLISLASFVFLLPVQTYVTRINAAKGKIKDNNGRFGLWNAVFIFFGGLLLLAMLSSGMLFHRV